MKKLSIKNEVWEEERKLGSPELNQVASIAQEVGKQKAYASMQGFDNTQKSLWKELLNAKRQAQIVGYSQQEIETIAVKFEEYGRLLAEESRTSVVQRARNLETRKKLHVERIVKERAKIQSCQRMTSNSITPPGSTIGIVGGGQLGRMLARAASRMGYKTHIYTPDKDSPASHVATKTTIGAYQDTAALRAFGQSVDVVTFEFENIPGETLTMLEAVVQVRPKPSVLFTTRHRLREKEFIRAQGIQTAPFAAVRTQAELDEAIATIGVPSVLKTCEMGYDGKGQVVIKSEADAANAWVMLGKTECILEGFITFSAEASVIVARSTHGEARCYPLVQNIHRDHILHKTIAPAPFIDVHQEQAVHIAKTLAEALDVVGLLAVELFVTDKGLLVNELAPRPHNSGHWSMEGAPTSQFEQHIRAICGWALGDTTARACEMINLLGDEWKLWETYASQPEAHVHLYGKSESRPGRKMGHVTIVKRQ